MVTLMNRSLILNIDINSVITPFLTSLMERPAIKEEDFFPFVDQYIDLISGKPSQLRALAFDIFCQLSAVDSAYMTDYSTYVEKKLASGASPADLLPFIYPVYRMNHEFGIEPWNIFMRRCRERGVEAWVSVRMNDAHDGLLNDEECLAEEYVYRARWRGHAIGARYGYFGKCLDYAHDEVRERMLGYLGEMLTRYDTDGLELDFMREIWCFDYLENPNCCAIMTDFIRNVRALVRAAEEKHGHPITLSIRLPAEIEQCRVWGFDVEAWEKEHLVDHITVTPRWSSSDDGMPIHEWVSRFPSIRISAGVETLLRIDDLRRPDDDSCVHLDADTVNGLAASYLSQGAEGIYLFNYFSLPIHTPTSATHGNARPLSYLRTQDILSRCGDIKSVLSSPRRHIVMYQDIVPEGFTARRPLPCRIAGSTELTIPTGEIPAGAKAELRVAFSEGAPENTAIALNGQLLNSFVPSVQAELTELPTSLILRNGSGVPVGSALYACLIPTDITFRDTVQTVSFRAENACITHLELYIY
ncbi:MAG: hypothetical protein J6S76_00865 [Clostridia bacterium]|nr:hypothetical protein [Clostridia bacterium]